MFQLRHAFAALLPGLCNPLLPPPVWMTTPSKLQFGTLPFASVKAVPLLIPLHGTSIGNTSQGQANLQLQAKHRAQ